MTPENVLVRKDRSRLVIEWADGIRIDLTASKLRDLCQSAKSKRLAMQGLLAPAAKDLSIEDVSAIGRYGINVAFSDGHDRGIYPWIMLREHALASRSGAEISCDPAINCESGDADRVNIRKA
ncbi:MAG: DUF971 domain-containing protein [Rhodospirillaceae bacterium TMED63]|nr:MAG: DUF971 domain-containing protein [Rhodospirillaceae bacterium TMED63]